MAEELPQSAHCTEQYQITPGSSSTTDHYTRYDAAAGTADAVVTDFPAVEVEVQARNVQDSGGMKSLTAVVSEEQGGHPEQIGVVIQPNIDQRTENCNLQPLMSTGIQKSQNNCQSVVETSNQVLSIPIPDVPRSLNETSYQSHTGVSVSLHGQVSTVSSDATENKTSDVVSGFVVDHQVETIRDSTVKSNTVGSSEVDDQSLDTDDHQVASLAKEDVSTPRTTCLSQADVLQSVQLQGKKSPRTIREQTLSGRNPTKNSLWCEDCGRVNVGPCKKHGGLTSISDSHVPTYARLTLPSVLAIKQDAKGEGVFAKKYIKSRSQFGPLIAPFCLETGKDVQTSFYLMGYDDSEALCQYSLTDENLCNWMMFVRPAQSYTDQNLIAYLYDDKLYFATIKPIEHGRELKVWYSSDYAVRIGWSPLITDSSQSVKGSVEKNQNTESPKPDAELDPESDGDVAAETDDEYRVVENDLSEEEEEFDYCFCVQCDTQFKSKEQFDSHCCKTSKKTNKKVGGRGATKRKGSPRKLTLDDDWDPPSKKRDVRSKRKKRKVGRTSKERTKAARVKRAKLKEVGDSPRKKYQRTPKFSCAYCPEVFTSQDPFRAHEASHTGKSAYMCDYEGCGKGFDTKFTHWRHMLCHKKPHDKQCPYCEKNFNRMDHLKTHLKVHDQQRFSYLCDKCGKSYLHKSTYNYHIALHEAKEGMSLVCMICSEEFPSKEELIQHTLSHNRYKSLTDQPRKYSCTQCHRKFQTNKDVRRHMVVHTKEKHFLCELCPQTFGRKDHLQRHYKTNHSKEPKKEKSDEPDSSFSCDLCQQKFNKKKLLVNHKKYCPEQNFQAIVTIQEHPLQQAAGEITEASVTSSSYNLYTLSNPQINPSNQAAKAIERYIATNVSSTCSPLNPQSSVMDTSSPVTFINGQTNMPLNVCPQVREHVPDQMQQGKERIVFQDPMVTPRQSRQVPWTFVVEERDDHSYSSAAAPLWTPKVPNFRPAVSTAAEIETARLLQSAQSAQGSYVSQNNNTTTMAVAWDTMTDYFAVQPCNNLSSITEVVTSPNVVQQPQQQQQQQLPNQSMPQQQSSHMQQNHPHQ